MFYTYILKLNNKDYYIGHTTNLKQRVFYHKSGKVFSTRNKLIELVYYSAFKTKDLAVRFEKYLKSSSGFAFRNKHLI